MQGLAYGLRSIRFRVQGLGFLLGYIGITEKNGNYYIIIAHTFGVIAGNMGIFLYSLLRTRSSRV